MTKVLYILSFTAMFAWVCLTNFRLDRLEGNYRQLDWDIKKWTGVETDFGISFNYVPGTNIQKVYVSPTTNGAVFQDTYYPPDVSHFIYLSKEPTNYIREPYIILRQGPTKEISVPYYVPIQP